VPLVVENTALEDASLEKKPGGAVLIGIQKEEGPPGEASVLFVEYPRQPLFVLLSLEI